MRYCENRAMLRYLARDKSILLADAIGKFPGIHPHTDQLAPDISRQVWAQSRQAATQSSISPTCSQLSAQASQISAQSIQT
jgi:hypothetical protein